GLGDRNARGNEGGDLPRCECHVLAGNAPREQRGRLRLLADLTDLDALALQHAPQHRLVGGLHLAAQRAPARVDSGPGIGLKLVGGIACHVLLGLSYSPYSAWCAYVSPGSARAGQMFVTRSISARLVTPFNTLMIPASRSVLT